MTEENAGPGVTVVGGNGEPRIAVVGSIHGDEPEGAKAIERLLADNLGYSRPVKYIVANPPALERNVRYIDADMNRVFPGDAESEDLERRLAARVCEETAGYTTLALHSTRSKPEPFALVSRCDPDVLGLASKLPVEHIVDESALSEGSYTNCGSVVSVECGCQGTDEAADAAERVVRAFLDVTGAVETGYEPNEGEPEYFEIGEAVPKEPGKEHELLVENFAEVREDETYARSGGEPVIADRSFYPILMSEDGYAEVLGYRGRKVASNLEDAIEYFGV
jgi:predicted deacylase